MHGIKEGGSQKQKLDSLKNSRKIISLAIIVAKRNEQSFEKYAAYKKNVCKIYCIFSLQIC